MPRRARSAHAYVAALCVLSAACGTATERPLTPAMSHAGVLSQAKALAVVQAYDRENNRVNGSLDISGIAGIETDPLRASSVAWMTVSKRLRTPIPAIRSTEPKFAIPKETANGQWFLTICQRVKGGVPSPQPSYVVYAKPVGTGTFRAAYSLTPTEYEKIPDLAYDSSGAALATSSPRDLAVAPADLGRAITDHYVKHLSGKDALAFSKPLDEQLGAGYNLGVSALAKRDVVLKREVDSSPSPWFALRAKNGGALVFSTARVTDTLKSRKPGGRASLRAGSNDAALLGKPEGATAPRFTIRRLEMFMSFVPPANSGGKVKVLAFSETATSVRA
ncbi:hypothetical protein [Streptomyces sp. NPDC086010]|uniref:hypothetical protein n=1 Tax=Streptomyces sp. NPDC086010 TaxID=3365745 RepID=UPI0037D482BA